MKINKLPYFALLIVFIFAGCAKDKYNYNSDNRPDSNLNGNVEIFLEKKTTTVTKVTESDLSVDDFHVEIFNSNNVRIKYWKAYSELKGTKFRLNAGDYKMLAYYGDSTKTGFDALYFAGLNYFKVEQGKSVAISATCKMANVKMAVATTSGFEDMYTDYTVKMFRKNFKDTLTFVKGDTKAGFIPAGEVSFKIFLKDKHNAERMYQPEPLVCKANEFITLKLDSKGEATYEIAANFSINTETDNKELEFTIPGMMKPKAKPSATINFTSPSSFVEGVAPDNTITINAEGYIASVVIKSTSQQLQQFGLGEEGKDLASLSTSDSIVLADRGLRWSPNLSKRKVADINIGEFVSNLAYDASNNSHTITVVVKDAFGQQTEQALEYVFTPIQAQVSISDIAATDMWSTFAYVTLTSNVPAQKLSVQSKSTDWATTACELVSENGNTYIYKVKELVPGTSYTFRGRYDGRTQPLFSAEKSGSTENSTALSNAGFEDWTTKSLYGGNGTWSASISTSEVTGWATRNSRTTSGASSATASLISGNYGTNYRWCDGTVSVSSCTEGSKAAEISTLAFYNNKVAGAYSRGDILTMVQNNGTPYAGYLFLGTYDSNSDTYNLGISHPDRPVSLSFDYKFSPIGDDKAIAYAKVYDASNNLIAETEAFASNTATEFASATLVLNYSNLNVKAAKIVVFFQSGTNLDMNSMNQVNGSYSVSPFNRDRVVGSVLTVDNVKLNY